MSNVTFDMKHNSMEAHNAAAEPWRVTLVDTGEKTMIGGRIKRILPYLGDDKEFCLTYGDGVGNVDVRAAIDLHHKEGRLATVTATQPPGRFGAINYQGSRVTGFQEKPMGDGGWINGGFFVLSPEQKGSADQSRSTLKSPWAAPPVHRCPLHDDEASALQMFNEPLADDLRHDFVGVMLSLAAMMPGRKPDHVSQSHRKRPEGNNWAATTQPFVSLTA